MKESSYKESKVPREELLNYVVIDGKGNKISKEEMKSIIEKKSLDNNQKDINPSETNSVQIPQTPQSSQITQITILSLGLNEQTNKEKLISFFGKDITKFDHLHEAVQYAPKISALALAKKFGVNKDIYVMYLKSNDNEHYGRADSLYFNKNNYYTEQDKFLCYKNNLLTHPLTYEKI
jgi:hypothetical protein